MKGYEVVARALAHEGTDTVFGVVGDANLYIVDELVRSCGVRYVAAAHEGAASLMAIGSARASGRVGVATVTHGPGLTNTFTALVEGVRSATPVVLVAGDTDPARPDHPQNIDQHDVARASGAGFEQVRSLAKAGEDISRAFWRATTEERPIVLNVPAQLQLADGDWQPFRWNWVTRQPVSPDPDALDRALGIVASAHRPILLAGRGAIGARQPLLRLADCIGAPVATTALGSGLFRGEPFDLGIFGTLSHPIAAETIARTDCVVAFGASMNAYTTDAGRLLKGKRVVQCDVTASRFGRLPRCDVGVVGDAGRTAETMVGWLGDVEHEPSSFRTEELRSVLAAREWVHEYADRSTAAAIDPRTFTAALDGALPDDRTVVVDVGRFMIYGLTFPVPDPAALVTTHGFQSLGLGAAAAIGAGIARPDRPVILLVGDGGFMMGGLTEFQTAVRCGIDLIVVVYNDACYGAEHVQLYRKGLDARMTFNNWPDFAAVANAMGGSGVHVRSHRDLDAMTEVIASRRSPLLIDVALDTDVMSELMS